MNILNRLLGTNQWNCVTESLVGGKELASVPSNVIHPITSWLPSGEPLLPNTSTTMLFLPFLRPKVIRSVKHILDPLKTALKTPFLPYVVSPGLHCSAENLPNITSLINRMWTDCERQDTIVHRWLLWESVFMTFVLVETASVPGAWTKDTDISFK